MRKIQLFYFVIVYAVVSFILLGRFAFVNFGVEIIGPPFLLKFIHQLGFVIISISRLTIWYVLTWFFIREATRSVNQVRSTDIDSENLTAIRIARYNHLNSEITRYRDLSWKIVGFTWAIYYALIRSFNTAGDTHEAFITHSYNPGSYFFFFMFLTAVFAAIFHLFCEIMVCRNQEARRALEGVLGMLNSKWAHQGNQEDPCRFGFLFSVAVFACIVWLPPLFLLYWRNTH